MGKRFVPNLLAVIALLSVGILQIHVRPSFAYQTKLQPLDIESIHLYVRASAVAKADSGFSTRHFKKITESGEVERRAEVEVFKNRPIFQQVDGEIRINNQKKIKVNWRYRGLLSSHWKRAFPFKSMKIFLSKTDDQFSFHVLNLIHIEGDPYLYDVMAHEIHHLYGMMTPRMKLVRFYVNDEYAGFKILLEEIDEKYLENHKLSPGNVYTEDTSAIIGDRLNSGINFYKYWWVKRTFRIQKSWEDWIHLNHLLALGRQETAEHLLDKDYYLSWLALGLWVPISGSAFHNIYMYHNLATQKWYPFAWDMGVRPFGKISGHIAEDEEVLLVARNKIYVSVLIDPINYHQRNKLAYQFLRDDQFFVQMGDMVRTVYDDYIKELEFCKHHLSNFEHSPYATIDIEEIKNLKNEADTLIQERRDILTSKLSALPRLEVSTVGNTLKIKGKSLTGFKIKSNGWQVRTVKNLTPWNDSNDEKIFLINFVDTLSQKRVPNYLEPKVFFLELASKLNGDHRFPEISSLFPEERKEHWASLKEFVISENVAIQTVDDAEQEAHATGLSNIWQRMNQFASKVSSLDLFSKLNDQKYMKVFLERMVLSLERFKLRDYLPEEQVLEWDGEKVLSRTTVVPHNTTLILKPGTTLRMGKKVSLIVEGNFIAQGTEEEKVLITTMTDPPNASDHWGSICFAHSLSQNSSMAHVIMEYGSEDLINGIYCKGALSVYHVPFRIDDSEFRFNQADDAVNFLYSKAEINHSKFHHNRADAVDLDFSHVSISNSEFYDNGNDGVDCGTSVAKIQSNIFKTHTDKAISIGEQSDVNIQKNIFLENNKAIAIKDQSVAEIIDNIFVHNQFVIHAYIKKPKFDIPIYSMHDNYLFENVHNVVDETRYSVSEVEKTLHVLENASQLKAIANHELLSKALDQYAQTVLKAR